LIDLIYSIIIYLVGMALYRLLIRAAR